jgi:type III secretion system FlhB-like substrate exporter
MDPSRLAELESVNETLQYWQTQFQDAPASSEINGGGLKLLEKTRPAIKISGLEDIALVESTMSRALKRQIMNKLQVRLVAFNDHIEIKCRIPYESYKSIAVIMTIGL